MHGNTNYLMNIILGALAVVSCIAAVIQSFPNHAVLFASTYLALISINDAKFSKIPNYITFSFGVFSLAFNTVTAGWGGLGLAFVGAATGLALLLPLFFLGGMGAGDVKALAALGALMGPKDITQIFLYMGLFGGIVGILYLFTSGRLVIFFLDFFQQLKKVFYFKNIELTKAPKSQSGIRFPYAVAIAFGFSIHSIYGGIF